MGYCQEDRHPGVGVENRSESTRIYSVVNGDTQSIEVEHEALPALLVGLGEAYLRSKGKTQVSDETIGELTLAGMILDPDYSRGIEQLEYDRVAAENAEREAALAAAKELLPPGYLIIPTEDILPA